MASMAMSMLPTSKRNKRRDLQKGWYGIMDKEFLITLVLTFIGSSAIWEFIKFLLERKDKKKEKKDECSQEILKAIQALNEKVDKLDRELGESKTVAARIRILKFMDELLEGRRHTKDSYDQVIYSDITEYEKYCKEHPDFKNNQTAQTIEFINKNYQERLQKHDFL